MTFINQWPERGPKCGDFQPAASEGRGPPAPVLHHTGPHAWLWCCSSVPGDSAYCFSRNLVVLVSCPRLKTQVHWDDDGPRIQANAGTTGSSFTGLEAQAVPGCKATPHSRKRARAQWAGTVQNMTTGRLAGLHVSWKEIYISSFGSNTWDIPPK